MISKFIKENRIIFYALVITLLLGFLFRSWKITTLPYPPNGDELAFGYYGWSLSHFGTDEYGNKFPVYFPSIGDYKLPILPYLNIIPVSIFGLTDFTVRFWSLVSGSLLIVLIFIISFLVFGNSLAALFAAVFLSFAPWNITLSRVGYESNVGNLLTSGAILILILAIKSYDNNKIIPIRSASLARKILLTLFFVLLIISSFTYGSQRIFIPSFLILLFISFVVTKKYLKPFGKPVFLIFIISTFIIAASLIPWQSRGRASGVVWKIPQEKISKDIFYDGISTVKTPLLVTRIYHNKISSFLLETANRYISYYSPGFLFFKGDLSPETTPDVGILLHIEIIFLLAGIFGVLNLKNNIYKYIILIWLLAGPLAASTTSGGPHLVRGSIMFPPLALFSGYGLFSIINSFKKQSTKIAVLIISLLLMLINLSFILHQILVHKSVTEPWSSDQGKKELVSEVLSRKDNYKAVVMKGDPYIFFLYYGKISPLRLVNDSEITPESRENQWNRVKRFSNIYFEMPFDCPKGGKLNVLYVCRGSEVPQNAKILKVIYFLDGIPAYSLIEFYPFSKAPQEKVELQPMLKYMVEKETKYKDGVIPEDYPSFW